jgi:hypothetical protein
MSHHTKSLSVGEQRRQQQRCLRALNLYWSDRNVSHCESWKMVLYEKCWLNSVNGCFERWAILSTMCKSIKYRSPVPSFQATSRRRRKNVYLTLTHYFLSFSPHHGRHVFLTSACLASFVTTLVTLCAVSLFRSRLARYYTFFLFQRAYLCKAVPSRIDRFL